MSHILIQYLTVVLMLLSAIIAFKLKNASQLFEIIMDFINKEIVIPNIGKNYTKTWTPVAMTFFVFILTCNLLGLIPFFEY